MSPSLRTLLRAVGAALLVVLTVRCDLSDPVEPDRLVVEAFFETGQGLPPVRLRSTRAVGVPIDSTEDAAEGGRVSVRVGDAVVDYVPAPEPGVYVPSRPTVRLNAGTQVSLTARWQGEVARGKGQAPPPVRIDSICVDFPDVPVRAILVDSLRRDSLDIPAEQGFIYPIDVEVEWTPPPSLDTTFWMRAQLRPTAQLNSRVVSFFLQPGEVNRETQFDGTPTRRRWFGVYAIPVDAMTAPLPEHRLAVALTRGDASFADFASSRTDPDRREPTSNVDGGLGIATAIALDSLSLQVTPDVPQCRP